MRRLSVYINAADTTLSDTSLKTHHILRFMSVGAWDTCLLISIQSFKILNFFRCSQWPACLLRLGVRIPPGAWMSVFWECCVWSRRGLCDELITRPEEFSRLWCVIVCDLETSWMRRPWPFGGCCPKNKLTNKFLLGHASLYTCL
jgi:hypothetical protein